MAKAKAAAGARARAIEKLDVAAARSDKEPKNVARDVAGVTLRNFDEIPKQNEPCEQ